MAYKTMKALVTGVTGQDGSYLAELLLKKGYEVCGMYRRTSTDNCTRVKHLMHDSRFSLRYGDLQDSSSLVSLIADFCPDEVYNLASQSDVGASFKLPLETAEITGVGVLRLLEAIRSVNKNIRFYQASSSEMFGEVEETPQKETTPLKIRSPYGAAKLFGYWITRNYREAYGMFCCNGILFNHESPRRGDLFVTQKIVKSLVKQWKREGGVLELGNLDSKRDWGFAGDYVEAMWLMLQQKTPDDFVIATGETHSVREFVEAVASELDWIVTWKGTGVNQEGFNQQGDLIVQINPNFYRPAEVNLLVGEPSKAWLTLGWKPEHSFKDLVKMMVDAELNPIIAHETGKQN
jgi:GDPmannose 4,6-dehydratase